MHEIYKQTLDVKIGGCKPKKANGTCWILCLDKWGLYIDHLEEHSGDKGILRKDR